MTRSTTAAAALGAHARVRTRKLNTRTNLAILRQEDLQDLDDEAQRNVPRIDTGIEKAEESEHHLQAALSASNAAAIGGKVAQIYIPTPDAVPSSIDYEKLYPLKYKQPQSYIRFSSTVEDVAGCPYNMDEQDDAFLKSMNRKKNASTQCSEAVFEEVMTCFEETAQSQQPWAAVDSPPVISYDITEETMDDYLDYAQKRFAKEIYEHWKTRRLEAGNKSLIRNLKFETGADTDDADPYVCFRRREVRQIRKTRGRDAHSAEKLKKLRKELEESRELLAMIKQRELHKREQLEVERQLFEQRTNLRQVKQNLPDQYKQGDEDILINQKPKKKPLEITQRMPNIQITRRTDGRSAETDLLLLSEWHAEREREISEAIEEKIRQHEKWNEGFVDLTKAPLTPPSETGIGSTFRTATTEYFLPTPPASVSSEHSGDGGMDFGTVNLNKAESVAVRYASPSYDGPCHSQPSFRRRYGRGGRLLIDRRGLRMAQKENIDTAIADRYKYDDEDDEDEVPRYYIDPFDTESMVFRSRVLPGQPTQAQMQTIRAQRDAAIAAAQAANHGNPSTRPARQPGSDGYPA